MEVEVEVSIQEDNVRDLQNYLQHVNSGTLQLEIRSNDDLLLSCCDYGALNCASTLLEHGADKDCLDSEQTTPLMHAVIQGSAEITRLLVTWGCQINTLGGSDGQSALHLAAQKGAVDVSAVLVKAGANVNIKNASENTPLILASAAGHLAVVKLLLGWHAFVHHRGYHECSALHEAAECGHYEVCSCLIEAKAHVENEDTFGNTPLIVAAEKGHVNLVCLFLAQGADVNRQTHMGFTALHYAAKAGWIACVKVLLHHGAEVDVQDIRRFTPLMMAALEGQVKVMRMLLEVKANFHMAAYNRRTALHYAAEQGNISCCQMLLDAGAKLEAADVDLSTSVLLSAGNGKVETTRFLLDQGASATQQTNEGLTILHLAAESGTTDICDLLIQRGVDMDALSKEWRTPILCAVAKCHYTVVRFLISKGCSLHKQSWNSPTVLNEAIFYDFDLDVIEDIIAGGANPNECDGKLSHPLWYAVEKNNLLVVKLLLKYNSNYLARSVSSLATCTPCCALIHAAHKENMTMIRWMTAALPGEAYIRLHEAISSIISWNVLAASEAFHAGFREINELVRFEINDNMLNKLKPLISQPPSLLCLGRRAVRCQLGTGFIVTQNIAKLELPSLLHKYMLFSDFEV